MKKKLSIHDIAKQLNISITSVSFILNGKAKEKRISEALTNRVLKLVQEMDYKPNQIAQSLRTGKTKIIGLMVEDISNVFFANVARLIEEKAHRGGYKIIYCSTENNAEKTRDLIRMYKDWQIDGYIITPPAGIDSEIQSLIDDNVPVILFDRFLPGLETNYILIDNFKSTYTATHHLIEQGYKNIAFVTLDSQQSQMLERLRGYEEAVADHDLKKFTKRLAFENNSERNVELITSFLKKNKEIDAVFFGTNYLGVWGLQAIKDLGIRIQKDLGVVSFDDHDIFKLNTPSITAVAQPIEEISKEVISMMLKLLDDSHTKDTANTTVLPASLIVRESSVREKS